MSAPKPQPYTRWPEDPATYAQGLRHLADLIESGDAPIPSGTVDLFLCYGALPSEDQPAAARDLMRALGGGTYEKDPSDTTLCLNGMCGGVPVRIYTERAAVCERVVVGTETVKVPAQPAVKAHTETREVVEWRCAPLLAATSEDADTIEVSA